MHRWSFMMKENAILISQPYKYMPNVFEIKTNVDSGSEISLNITIEQYLQKRFNFNELTIQILRNFSPYNIDSRCGYITFLFDVSDECGIYDVSLHHLRTTLLILIKIKVIVIIMICYHLFLIKRNHPHLVILVL